LATDGMGTVHLGSGVGMPRGWLAGADVVLAPASGVEITPIGVAAPRMRASGPIPMPIEVAPMESRGGEVGSFPDDR
jgi:hypothetical protein